MIRAILLCGVGALILAWADSLIYSAINGESNLAAPLSIIVLLTGLAFAGAGVAEGIKALRNL